MIINIMRGQLKTHPTQLSKKTRSMCLIASSLNPTAPVVLRFCDEIRIRDMSVTPGTYFENPFSPLHEVFLNCWVSMINLVWSLSAYRGASKNTDICTKQIVVVSQFGIHMSRPTLVSRSDKFKDGLGSRLVIPVDTCDWFQRWVRNSKNRGTGEMFLIPIHSAVLKSQMLWTRIYTSRRKRQRTVSPLPGKS